MSVHYQFRIAKLEAELHMVRASHKQALESVRFSLQDALCFAELIEAIAKPDVEMYKHELRNDSDLAQRRLRNAIEAVDIALGDDCET